MVLKCYAKVKHLCQHYWRTAVLGTYFPAYFKPLKAVDGAATYLFKTVLQALSNLLFSKKYAQFSST